MEVGAISAGGSFNTPELCSDFGSIETEKAVVTGVIRGRRNVSGGIADAPSRGIRVATSWRAWRKPFSSPAPMAPAASTSQV